MILIITNEADFSTNVVIDWLHFFNAKYIRINKEDLLNVVFNDDDIIFYNNELSFRLSSIKCTWYRRGFLNLTFNTINDDRLDAFRREEFIKAKEYIYYELSKLPSINNIENSDVNKLIVNDMASDLGLRVPFEKIISNSESLKRLKKKRNLATKSISGSTTFIYDNFYFTGYTSFVKKEKTAPTFFPSLVQDYIEKKYELRIFFMNDSFWTMAIFSQADQQTKVDFRNYNNEKPNRNVPFTLPNEISKKLLQLTTKLKINCGSIDMIVTPENEYFFLEINPVGQFGMVSNPCNYELHKEIALSLMQHL